MKILNKFPEVWQKIIVALLLSFVFVAALLLIIYGGLAGDIIGILFCFLVATYAIFELTKILGFKNIYLRLYSSIVPISFFFIMPYEEGIYKFFTEVEGDMGKTLILIIKEQLIFPINNVHAVGYIVFIFLTIVPVFFMFNEDKKTLFIKLFFLLFTTFGVCLTTKLVLYYTNFKFSIIAIVISGTVATDVFAYFGGMFLGKYKIFSKKLMPKVSPKKTIIGAICGFISSFLLVFLSFYFSGSLESIFVGIESQALVIIIISSAFIIPIFSIMGDLAFSYLKRIMKTKDFSNLLPSHGGVLDRFDSTIYSVTIFSIMLVIVFQFFQI